MQAFRRLSGQFGGFLAVGAVNTMLSLLLYEVLILVMPYWLAYTLCFPAGIAFLLFANAGLVFRRAVTAASAASFILFYLASYAAGLGVIIVLVGVIRIPPAFAPLGAIAIMAPINFIGSRFALGRK
jgi:putative flippase GtrA